MKGKLIIISAPSGSGKTTIVHHLLQQPLNMAFSISATSRGPRGNEENGKDYYFLDAEEFKAKIAAGEFLEWEEVYPDQYYGTLRSEVERLRNQGKHVLFDIDVEGGIHLKEVFGDAALSIFVQAPGIDVIAERLKKRASDSPEQLEKRNAKAEKELSYASRFDRILVNDNLDLAFRESERLVRDFIEK